VTKTVTFDASDVDDAASTVDRCFTAADGPVDLVVIALGLLGSTTSEVAEPSRISELIIANFTWPAAAMGAVASRLQAQGHGRIIVLSSVAGVRIRAANYLYGSAKAGLDAFARGLAETLRGSGVLVQVVRPGFVHTKMTRGHRPAPFAVSPQVVAAAVDRGIERNQAVIWVPGFLRWVFAVLRVLPQSLWRRLPE